MATTAREGRRGGRAARREARTAPQRRWLPVLERAVPVYEILDPERLELIHRASLDILEEIGIDFRDDEASRMWRAAGAEVERYRVRIPGELLMALVAEQPEPFRGARAQSRAQHWDRRQQSGVRADLRLTVRV